MVYIPPGVHARFDATPIYHGPPPLSLTSITPNSGWLGGNEAKVISGAGFKDAYGNNIAYTVIFGTAPGELLPGAITALTPTSISVTTPSFAGSGYESGEVINVVVEGTDGTSNPLPFTLTG